MNLENSVLSPSDTSITNFMGIATIIGLGFLNISKLSWKNFFLMSFNKKKSNREELFLPGH